MNKQNNNQFRLWKHFFIDFIKTKGKLHLPTRHAAVSKISRNDQDSWENKTNCFPQDLTLSV